MNTLRACTILTSLALTLNACTGAPAEPDVDPVDDTPRPTDVTLALFDGESYTSFDAFAQSVGSVDAREETILLGAEGEGSAAGFITTGGLVARGGKTERVLLAGKPGALYEVAVLDSWDVATDFFPYSAVRLRGEGLPTGYFELSYDHGRTSEVEGGTSYDHTGLSLICKPIDARFACATFVVARGAYVEPDEGSSGYEIPNSVVIGDNERPDIVEVMVINEGDALTPAGEYRLVTP